MHSHVIQNVICLLVMILLAELKKEPNLDSGLVPCEEQVLASKAADGDALSGLASCVYVSRCAG